MNKLSTKIRQKQSIIPKQILQSSFLELGLDEIEKELENEIQKNPVLIEKNAEDFRDKGDVSYGLEKQDSYDLFLENIKEEKNAIDNLINQIDQSEIDNKSKKIAQQIVFNVDNNDFLDSELELIADSEDATMEDVENTLAFVKTLSPKGVGCKNLQEYLLLQIDDDEQTSLDIIKNHFDQFLNQEFLDIKSSLSCSDTDFDNAMNNISSKNFAPIVDLNAENQQVNPDIILRLKDDKWIILVNDRHLSKFKISNEYLNAAMDQKTSKEEKKFIDDHISSAQSILDTITFRSNTLKKVVKEIIDLMRDRGKIPCSMFAEELKTRFNLVEIPMKKIEDSVWGQLTKDERIGTTIQGFRQSTNEQGEKIRIPHVGFSADLDYLDEFVNRLIKKATEVK